MCGAATTLLLVSALVPACAGNPDKRTLADLHRVEPDVTEVRVEDGLDQAMLGYKKFLEQAAESALTPEAMRRLADLKLEKEYGFLGQEGEAGRRQFVQRILKAADRLPHGTESQ